MLSLRVHVVVFLIGKPNREKERERERQRQKDSRERREIKRRKVREDNKVGKKIKIVAEREGLVLL